MNEARKTSLADAVDALLPQTQCTRCGYASCRSYAEAIAADEADINRCPPGGAEGIRKLAVLLGRDPVPLDPACGTEGPLRAALIDEDNCIGCTLCIRACPVDAIVGAPKLMHTVVTELCSGCELCIPACPMDCMTMVLPEPAFARWTPERAAAARARFDARAERLAREERERAERLSRRAATQQGAPGSDAVRAAVQAALERVRRRKASEETGSS